MVKKYAALILVCAFLLTGLRVDSSQAAPFSPTSSLLPWMQANTDGFGVAANDAVWSLAIFHSKLYVGTDNVVTGAQIWRTTNGGTWENVIVGGLGDPNNAGILSMAVAGDHLFMSTYNSSTGAEIWQTDGSFWMQLNSNGFGDVHNDAVWSMLGIYDSVGGGPMQEYVVAGTQNWTEGAQLWKHDPSLWTAGTLDGFGNVHNGVITSMCLGGANKVYVGIGNTVTGAQIIQYDWVSGAWTALRTDAFGDLNNWDARSMVCLEDYLLVGTYNQANGAEVWRYHFSDNTWDQVAAGGFGDPHNASISSMAAVGEYIYAGTLNPYSGAEVWRSWGVGNPSSWEQVNLDGFGDAHNEEATSLSGFGRYLFVGTRNILTGAEMWRAELHGPDEGFLIKNPNPSSQPVFPNSAYNSQDKEYLVVWQDVYSGVYDDQITGQRLTWGGKLIGTSFSIAPGAGEEDVCPGVAYDTSHHKYLVTYGFDNGVSHGVAARVVSASGGVSIPVNYISMSSTLSYCPIVRYASISDRYLLVFPVYDSITNNHTIWAQALNDDGTLYGPAVAIRQIPFIWRPPNLAYNPILDEFLVVWAESTSFETPSDVYGQRVRMGGGVGLQGSPFSISNVLDGDDDEFPSVGWLNVPSQAGQYLVAWDHISNLDHYTTVQALRVSGIGNLLGYMLVPSTFDKDSTPIYPVVVGLGDNLHYQVVWSIYRSFEYRYGTDILGRQIDLDGNVLGTGAAWLAGVSGRYASITAGPSVTALVVYMDMPPGFEYYTLFGRIIGLSEVNLPLVRR